MKPVLLAPLALLLIIAAVQARHRAARSDDVDSTSDNDDDDSTRERVLRHRERSTEQLRNRRRRWQSNYGYDYPPPHYPDYPPRRYENRQENSFPEILKLLDELADYVKRPPPPPPPPQLVYVPYPVPYPVLQTCNCRQPTTRPNTQTPTQSNTDVLPAVNLTSRWPEMEDPRQNWGFVTSDSKQSKLNDEDYVDDSIRPVVFASNSLNHPRGQKSAGAQRGSSQQSVTAQTFRGLPPTRRTTDTQHNLVGACDAATLGCCKPTDNVRSQENCFKNLQCGNAFRNGEACSPTNIRDAIERFTKTYSTLS